MSHLTTTPTGLDKHKTVLAEHEVMERLRQAYKLMRDAAILIHKNRKALAACGSCLLAPKLSPDQLMLDDILYGLDGIGAELFIQERTGGFPEEPTQEAVERYIDAIEDAREDWIDEPAEAA